MTAPHHAAVDDERQVQAVQGEWSPEKPRVKLASLRDSGRCSSPLSVGCSTPPDNVTPTPKNSSDFAVGVPAEMKLKTPLRVIANAAKSARGLPPSSPVQNTRKDSKESDPVFIFASKIGSPQNTPPWALQGAGGVGTKGDSPNKAASHLANSNYSRSPQSETSNSFSASQSPSPSKKGFGHLLRHQQVERSARSPRNLSSPSSSVTSASSRRASGRFSPSPARGSPSPRVSMSPKPSRQSKLNLVRGKKLSLAHRRDSQRSLQLLVNEDAIGTFSPKWECEKEQAGFRSPATSVGGFESSPLCRDQREGEVYLALGAKALSCDSMRPPHREQWPHAATATTSSSAAAAPIPIAAAGRRRRRHPGHPDASSFGSSSRASGNSFDSASGSQRFEHNTGNSPSHPQASPPAMMADPKFFAEAVAPHVISPRASLGVPSKAFHIDDEDDGWVTVSTSSTTTDSDRDEHSERDERDEGVSHVIDTVCSSTIIVFEKDGKDGGRGGGGGPSRIRGSSFPEPTSRHHQAHIHSEGAKPQQTGPTDPKAGPDERSSRRSKAPLCESLTFETGSADNSDAFHSAESASDLAAIVHQLANQSLGTEVGTEAEAVAVASSLGHADIFQMDAIDASPTASLGLKQDHSQGQHSSSSKQDLQVNYNNNDENALGFSNHFVVPRKHSTARSDGSIEASAVIAELCRAMSDGSGVESSTPTSCRSRRNSLNISLNQAESPPVVRSII